MSNVVRQYALLCVPTTCLMHLVLASLLGLLLLLPVFDLLDAAAATDVGNAADGHGSVTTSCPARCTCRPVTESSPCDWCSSTILPSAGASDAGTHASTSSSSSRLSAADNVSCEGCGAAAADGTSADLLDGDARRGLSASSRQEPLPSTDRPEITVSCADAGLTAVPFELPAATSTLDLAGNQLRQLDPGSLEFAPTEIDSDRDVLAAASTSLSSDFDGPRLINLRLRNNKIDRIASGSFRSPSAASIRVLDLADNRLTALDHGAFNGPMAESLEQLDLSGNAIGGDLGDGPFSALRRLVKLDLRDNLITELSPGSFRGLTSLRQLVLAGNSIKSIDRRTFKPLEKLVYIVLKGNPIGEQPIRFQASFQRAYFLLG